MSLLFRLDGGEIVQFAVADIAGKHSCGKIRLQALFSMGYSHFYRGFHSQQVFQSPYFFEQD